MERITIAIQKKGRLSKDSKDLLKRSGIEINTKNGELQASSTNFPIKFVYLRDDDIPNYVATGVADLGIVGLNEVMENGSDVDVVEDLGFSKCRLSIAVPKGSKIGKLEDMDGCRIATSYPNILRKYLSDNGLKGEVHTIAGSVEIAPTLGLADAIFDIVSSGSTLISNGLEEIGKICDSSAVLIKNKNLSDMKLKIVEKLLLRFRSILRAKNNKYILLNAPNSSIDEISKILPGMKSPTKLPLMKKGWSSIHSVVEENRFWCVVEQLKELGAQGILIIPIEGMVA